MVSGKMINPQFQLFMKVELQHMLKTCFIKHVKITDTSSYLECVKKILIRCRNMLLALNLDNTYLDVQRGVLLGYVLNVKWTELDLEEIAVIKALVAPMLMK